MNDIREKAVIELKDKISNRKKKKRKEEEEFDKVIREIKLQRQYLQQGRVRNFLFRLLLRKKHISR